MDERKSLLFYCLSVRSPRARQELLVICALRVDNAVIAQLVEQRLCKAEVLGSSPNGSSSLSVIVFSFGLKIDKNTDGSLAQLVER